MIDKIWAYLSYNAGMSFRRISLLSANSQPERYVYPASNPKGGVYHSLSRLWVQREALYCPARSCFAPTSIKGLSRRTHSTL